MEFLKVARVEGCVLEWVTSASSAATTASTTTATTTFYNIPAEHEGVVHLMAHHLVFRQRAHQTEFWLPYAAMATVERRPGYNIVDSFHRTTRTFFPVVVQCRLPISVKLLLPTAQAASDVAESLHGLVYTTQVERLYAFDYRPPGTTAFTHDGWSVYNAAKEFARMGVGSRFPQWRLSDVNRNFDLCPTYPRLLCVPAKISDAVLYHAAKFRSRGRLPALSYVYARNGMSITRSSQPLVGIKAKRSIQDEKLIEAVFDSHLPVGGALPMVNSMIGAGGVPEVASMDGMMATSAVHSNKNVIIDARPLGNAMANRAMGAGTESLENYRNCQRLFMGIDNIHVMRDSYQNLIDASFAQDTGVDRWLQSLDSTQWPKHIRNVMDATRLILKTLHHDGGHVLIHCSDGWDRTAQLSALAQLCLDPYFRTVRGFMVLVEKEWTGFGHKLNDRCGFLAVHPPKITSSSKSTSSLASASSVIATSGSSPFLGAVGLPSSITSHSSSSSSSAQRSSKEEKETAPVFLQFLECAQLIIRAYPDHFEFGEKMLVDLYAALQSCQFGTFLMNCEREREEKRIRERCQSYWSYVLQQPRAYVNPLYRGGAGGTGNVPPPLWPHVEPKHIRYWVGMHSRYDPPVLVAGALSLRSAAVQESPIGDGEDALDSDDFAAPYQPYSRLRPAVSRFYPYANHGDQEAYVENLAETLEACRSAAIYWRAKQIGKTITPVNDECKLRVARSTTTGHGWCIGAVTVDAHHLTWIKPGACQQCSALSSPLDRLNPCWSCGAIICTDCALASDGVAMWGGATKYRVCNKCTGERNANTTITE